MEPSFKGKRALVTGVGKGIGRAIAIKLASLGAHVIGLSRTQSDLDTLKAECPSLDVCLLDIGDWNSTRNTVEKLGYVDLLVNNAAIPPVTPFFDVTKKELDSVLDINFKAAFNITQVVAKSMIAKRNGGIIVNISSLCSMRVFPDLTTYSTSKAALDMLTQTLAVELGPSKIRVNSVNPTLVITPAAQKVINENPDLLGGMIAGTPLGKIAEVEDVVNTVVFLLSDQASMVNGVIMPVDGAMIVKCI